MASKSDAVEANGVDVVCQVPHMVQCHEMGSDSTTGGRLNQFLEAIEKGAELND